MKPISEYNFREIVGHFTLIQGVIIDPQYDKYLGYCYIDQGEGISFRILSMINDNSVKDTYDEFVILRYNKEIELDIYEPSDTIVRSLTNKIDEIYKSNINSFYRDKREYDPYRDKVFPDDLLLLTFITVNDKIESEPIWIRPSKTIEDNVIGITIEDGKYIHRNTQVIILNKEVIFKNDNGESIPSIFAATFDVLEKIVKEENNEI